MFGLIRPATIIVHLATKPESMATSPPTHVLQPLVFGRITAHLLTPMMIILIPAIIILSLPHIVIMQEIIVQYLLIAPLIRTMNSGYSTGLLIWELMSLFIMN